MISEEVPGCCYSYMTWYDNTYKMMSSHSEDDVGRHHLTWDSLLQVNYAYNKI
jgi:hypothetical protein